jgi:hypothetical protein
MDLALLVDDESHHPGVAPLCRPGHQREAPDHAPVDDLVVLAAGRVFALSNKDLEIVTMVG